MRRRRGQAIVEFAVVLPVFLLLILGVIDFGMVAHQSQSLGHAAREGARLAATGATESEIASRLYSELSLRWSADEISFDIAETDKGGYREITVSLTAPFTFVTPVGQFVSGLSSQWVGMASASFRKE